MLRRRHDDSDMTSIFTNDNHRRGRRNSPMRCSCLVIFVTIIIFTMISIQVYFIAHTLIRSKLKQHLGIKSESVTIKDVFDTIAENIIRPIRSWFKNDDHGGHVIHAHPVKRLVAQSSRKPKALLVNTATNVPTSTTKVERVVGAEPLGKYNDPFEALVRSNRWWAVPKDVVLPSEDLNPTLSIQFSEPVSTIDTKIRKPLDSRCEEQFGISGFKNTASFCTSSGTATGGGAPQQAQCQWNAMLKSSVCSLPNLVLDPSMVQVSFGGERIETVMGRSEDAEFPRLNKGAFRMQCPESLPDLHVTNHMQRMLSGLQVVSAAVAPPTCHWIEEPTLFVTRNEYANLYHTMAEWYCAYQVAELFGITREARVLFMDGHAAGLIDEPWLRMFKPVVVAQTNDSLPFVKHLKQTTCFRRAIWVPGGYESPLFVNQWNDFSLESCRRTLHLHSFAQRMLNQHGLYHTYVDDRRTELVINVLVVLRKGYVSHPRIGSRAHTPERVLDNPGDLIHTLRGIQLHSTSSSLNVKVVVIGAHFEEMSFQQQLEAIRDTDLLVGMHGAGLSYSVMLKKGASLLEMIPPSYSGRNHFKYFAAWNDVLYEPFVSLAPSANNRYKVDMSVMKERLRDLMPKVATRKLQYARSERAN